MQYVKANIGDTVWFFMGDHQGIMMTDGIVVHTFTRYHTTQYVIEVETHIDPILFIRDGLTITDDENKPIGAMRK